MDAVMNQIKKQKILITGHHGFIGSHLVQVLQQDYNVIGWDIKDKRDIFRLDDMLGADVIVHLAALTNVQQSMHDASRYFWVNTLGTAHVIETALKERARLIYISSAAVGAPTSSPYAYSKYVAEKLVQGMMEPLKAVILRPENVYGKGMNPESIMARFLRNDSLIIYGDGTHTRDYIHVFDVIQIIRYAIENNWQNMTLDVGTGKKTSVNQIAKIFHKYTKKPIVHLGAVTEVIHSHANVSRLKQLFPHPLQTNLEEDIKFLINDQN